MLWEYNVPEPGVESYVMNSYFLFGATSARINIPSATIVVAERNSRLCDVQVNPWLGEIYDEAGTKGAIAADVVPSACVVQPQDDTSFAVASTRHGGGANYLFADGHAQWERYAVTIANTPDQPCFGQYQAF